MCVYVNLCHKYEQNMKYDDFSTTAHNSYQLINRKQDVYPAPFNNEIPSIKIEKTEASCSMNRSFRT